MEGCCLIKHPDSQTHLFRKSEQNLMSPVERSLPCDSLEIRGTVMDLETKSSG